MTNHLRRKLLINSAYGNSPYRVSLSRILSLYGDYYTGKVDCITLYKYFIKGIAVTKQRYNSYILKQL
jgi:hypothetical protein